MALLTPLNVNCHASDGRKVKEPQLTDVWELCRPQGDSGTGGGVC